MRIFVRQSRGECVHPRLRLRHRDPRSQPRSDLIPVVLTTFEVRDPIIPPNTNRGDRQPEVRHHRSADPIEALWADPEHDDRLAVHPDAAAHDAGVASKLRAPEAVPHDRVVTSAHIVERGLKPPPEAWLDSQDWEIACGDEFRQGLSWSFGGLPGERHTGRRRNSSEHVGIGRHVSRGGKRARPGCSVIRVLEHRCHRRRISEGWWLEQHRVYDCECGSVGADAKRGDQDRRERERRTPP